MKKLSRTLSSRWMSSALSVVILGALCFSVGEGLRLTPFPVSNLAPIETTHLSSGNEVSASQYGPLNVPTQNQKRSKRQALDLSGPAIAGTRSAVPESSPLLDFESVNFVSLLSVTRPPGRAPPFRF